MNKKLLSLVCNVNEAVSLDDDFILIDNPNLAAIQGRVVKSTCNIILLCLEGSLNLNVDMAEITIKNNEVVYLMTGQLFEIAHISDTFRASTLLLSEPFIQWLDLKRNLLFRGNSGHAIKSSSHGSFEKYTAICKDIINFDNNPEKKVIIELLTKAYILGITHFGFLETHKLSTNNASAKITRQFLDLVNHGRTLHRTVEYYADILHISAKHLSFATTQCTGFSSTHWINQATILKAKQMLSDSNCQISEIADRLGFSNQSVFGRFFKKHTGLSPIEYRKEHHLM